MLQVLKEVMTGRRAQLDAFESMFARRFGGDQSPGELELALQMVHRLFTHSVRPVREELQTCLRFVKAYSTPCINLYLMLLSRQVAQNIPCTIDQIILKLQSACAALCLHHNEGLAIRYYTKKTRPHSSLAVLRQSECSLWFALR